MIDLTSKRPCDDPKPQAFADRRFHTLNWNQKIVKIQKQNRNTYNARNLNFQSIPYSIGGWLTKALQFSSIPSWLIELFGN